MKKLLAMIPAAVLAIGATAAAGAMSNSASSEKTGISVDCAAAFSKITSRKPRRRSNRT